MLDTLRKPTLQEILRQGRAERRLSQRTIIERNALLFFAGQPGLFGCAIRDVGGHGAGIRLNGLRVLPIEFKLSFDNFRTTRGCRMIWRDEDFVGVSLVR